MQSVSPIRYRLPACLFLSNCRYLFRNFFIATFLIARLVTFQSHAVEPSIGDPIPRDVREMYEAGVRYLVKTQDENGSWKGGENGTGTTALGLLAILASGEDPNFGLYSSSIKRALRSIIKAQDPNTGYLEPACTITASPCSL